jgi:hypothetical protein
MKKLNLSIFILLLIALYQCSNRTNIHTFKNITVYNTGFYRCSPIRHSEGNIRNSVVPYIINDSLILNEISDRLQNNKRSIFIGNIRDFVVVCDIVFKNGEMETLSFSRGSYKFKHKYYKTDTELVELLDSLSPARCFVH